MPLADTAQNPHEHWISEFSAAFFTALKHIAPHPSGAHIRASWYLQSNYLFPKTHLFPSANLHNYADG
ncbi:MAG TPA: hypothetical protein VLK66_26960 [Longimicrobium sp.]|nr:hypothetical protein [Longimicrobium sp.]